jgi:hypothetical protein
MVMRRSGRRSREIAATYKGQSPAKAFFVARLTLVCVFIVALTAVGAKPYVAYDSGGSFLFLTDVSRSMQARYSCAEPTFLGRAKIVMRDTLDGIPEARSGIVAFDRFAFPITSLTDDHTYLGEVIEQGVYIGLILEATQTELANALSVIAQKKQRLPEIFGSVRHVILLSDGHIGGDYRRRLRGPIQQLRAADIGILAVGIGNPDNTPITGRDAGQCNNQHIEVDGQKVLIPLRADILKFIANESRGQYFAEAETDKLIEVLRARLQSGIYQGDEPGTAQRRDISWVFLGLATLALLGFLCLPAVMRGK